MCVCVCVSNCMCVESCSTADVKWEWCITNFWNDYRYTQWGYLKLLQVTLRGCSVRLLLNDQFFGKQRGVPDSSKITIFFTTSWECCQPVGRPLTGSLSTTSSKKWTELLFCFVALFFSTRNHLTSFQIEI